MILLNDLDIETQNLNPNDELNLQAITLFASQTHFLLRPNVKKSGISTQLKIDRKSGQIEQMALNSAKEDQTKPYYFSLFLGIYQIQSHKLLCLAQDVLLICSINKRDIFRIIKPVFIFFQKSFKPQESITYQIRALTLIMRSGMFFSYSYNLALRAFADKVDEERLQQFNWIRNLQKEMPSNAWKITVIQGFVGRFSIFIHGKKLTMVLISRRSTKMAGTRYLSRGMNPQGQVANYVETEQVMLYETYMSSYVQIRGSLPLFWRHIDELKGLMKDVVVQKSIEENRQVCCLHLKKLQQQYGKITIVNLLQQTNKSEAKLISSFEKIFKQILKERPNQYQYAYYDVKKANNWKEKSQNTNTFIENSLINVVQSQGFDCYLVQTTSAYPIPTKQLEKQRGIFRTNCLDCVERTSLVQTKISALILVEFFRRFQINLNTSRSKTTLDFFDDMSNPLVKLFRCLWADNTDFISQQYTGTDSINSYYAHNGNDSVVGPIDQGLKSIWRTLIDVASYDTQKNKAIEKLLGQEPQPKIANSETQRTLKI